MGIKGLFGFGQARDKSVRNYSNGEYTFNFGRSTSGRSVNEMTAMQTTVVYACVRILSEAVASLLSGDGEMILAGLASFAQEESRSMSENNKWSIQKKFERGKYRVITFRKIMNQMYRQRCRNRCRKSGNRESVTGISDRTAQ